MDPVYFIGRLKTLEQSIESLKMTVQTLETKVDVLQNNNDVEIPEKFSDAELKLKLFQADIQSFQNATDAKFKLIEGDFKSKKEDIDARLATVEAELKEDIDSRLTIVQAKFKDDIDARLTIAQAEFKNDIDARLTIVQTEFKDYVDAKLSLTITDYTSKETTNFKRRNRVRGPKRVRGGKSKLEGGSRKTSITSECVSSVHNTSLCSTSSTLKNDSNIEDSYMSLDSPDESDVQPEAKNRNKGKSSNRKRLKASIATDGEDSEMFDAGEIHDSLTATSNSISDTMDDSSQQTMIETMSGEDVLSEPENSLPSNKEVNFGTMISNLRFEKGMATVDATTITNALKFGSFTNRVLKLAENRWKKDTKLPPNVEAVVIQAKSAKNNLDARGNIYVCKKCPKTFLKSRYTLAFTHSRTHFVKRRYKCGCCGYLSPSRTNYIAHLKENDNEECRYSITEGLSEQLEIEKNSKSKEPLMTQNNFNNYKTVSIKLERCPLIDDYCLSYTALMKRLDAIGYEY